MGAGPMGINHFFGCAVVMGVFLQTSFSTHALLSDSCAKKIALTVSQGSKTTKGKTLAAFRQAMRHLAINDSYGDQVFCESSRKCSADDVFHPSQNIYRIDREKEDILINLPSGVEQRISHQMIKNQIDTWLCVKEQDTHFPWWELPSEPSRYDIQCWCKKVCHDRSLVHRNMVHFAHTKHEGDVPKLFEEQEKCILRYQTKMKKESTKVVPVSKKRKQQKQRKLLHKSMHSQASSRKDKHFVDQLSFGYASKDGTMVSLGDLSVGTPLNWFDDEPIHSRIVQPTVIHNVGSNNETNKTPKSNLLGQMGESLIDIQEEKYVLCRTNKKISPPLRSLGSIDIKNYN
eukprot:scaffold74772_cov53-Attheya_sp.AAC.3